MEIEGPCLNVQKMGIVKQPDPVKPPPNNTKEEDLEGKDMQKEALNRRNAWEPSFFYSLGNETFFFTGQEISIRESLDSFGAVIWPGAVALCRYLEKNREKVDLLDKAVLELGAGTGLVSIVASLLGAWVTATDLPDVLSNLNFNLSRNTRGRCRYTPQVAALTWGKDVKRNFPSSVYHYNYVLCADVVYHHNFLEDLLITMQYFCKPGTTILLANKVRFQSDLRFIENFKNVFNVTLLEEIPQEEVRIYQATARK
ncbi:S-adenosylmethionine-dependent methyltransferase domain-containing protein isoform X2 [Megalobrama amblycephala]|uniref:S-adenosylmethionine-dependent methyltransferase domain-containing protein isoform X2 n=2 Tax=Megalobrama amblycephala TaxID=75352 RepID=UPI0020145574|nr:S-adenosylmethionine-dependent methyltransferase domain-containing protein isoform X2 [Megalobrama amblycephala]